MWVVLARVRRALRRLRTSDACTWCVGYEHAVAEFQWRGQTEFADRQDVARSAHIAAAHPELVDRFVAGLVAGERGRRL